MSLDIQRLIEEGGIETVMQLVISPNQDYAVGIEALSRGINPEDGSPVAPAELIARAEEKGMIQALEKLMFVRALETFKPLHDGNPDLLLFINLGSKFIEVRENSQFIDETVSRFGIPANSIFFDITSFDEKRIEPIQRFVEEFRKKGYYMSMDDLGEDYSNIDKVLYLNPDVVKINYRALRHLENKNYVENMIKTLKFITESLGILMVAKGIEDEQDVVIALENGAQFMQGYYISKPLNLTTEALVEVKDRYRHLMSSYNVEDSFRGELSRLVTTKAYVVMNGIKGILDACNDKGQDVDSQSIFDAFPMVENYWFLDAEGVQIGKNHVNEKNFKLKKTSMFQIYSEGTEFSTKDLFAQLYDTILNVWVTKPFKSILTNNLCVSSSIRLDYTPKRAVICANLNLELINKEMLGHSKPSEDDDDEFKVIIEN